MRRLIALVGMLCALVVAFPAAADRDDNRRSQRYERDDRRGYERERGDWRNGGNSRERAAERSARQERLSPDERRQLRRDIEDYGRDVYRERGRRGRN